MEDVHFPEVIYAYHGPEMGELIYNNARTTQLNCANVFFLQNSLCGSLYTYSQDEVILKYSWYHCWHHPEIGFINNILAIFYSLLTDLFTLRQGNERPELYTSHAQYVVITVKTLRGTTTLSQFKGRLSGAEELKLNPRSVYRCVQQDNYGCKYSPVNGKQSGINMKKILRMGLDLGSSCLVHTIR